MNNGVSSERSGKAGISALCAILLGLFLIAIDFSSLSVVIIPIEHELNTTLNRAQWVINAYGLAFGVIIVTGGRLADMFGRRRIFLIGCGLFAVFSLVGGLASSINLLVAARAVTGIGGALVWPAVIGMTYALLPKEKAGLAGGLVLGVIGLGNATGALLGGFLTDAFSWRWVLFINVPLAVIAMWLAWPIRDPAPESGRRGIDIPGITLLSAGIILILVGLDISAVAGVSRTVVLSLIVVGLVLLLGFGVTEVRSGENALIPQEVMRVKLFSGALMAVILMAPVFFTIMVYLPQFMQKTLGWSPFAAGIGLLPFMATQAVTSLIAGSLYEKLGGRTILLAGAVCTAAGVGLMSLLANAAAGYISILPGTALAGIGIGLFFSAVVTTAVTALDETKSSLAGGIVYMCQVTAGALGLGLNTAIVLTQTSLVEGMRLAFLLDMILALAALFILVALVRARTSGKGEGAPT